VPVKLFSSEFFPWFFALHVELGSARGGDVVGPKVFGKSLPRLETLRTTPPLFLQLNFLRRLILGEICSKSFKNARIAFCGNGFIHLNIAEIHEGNIGGQK